jgi:phosphatidylglycerophosphate synthase
MTQLENIKSTYKGKDTEELIDRLFYRPFGYVLALASRSLRLTPNAVTVISIFFGAGAGYFFYFDSFEMNIYGILLLVFANALDSADGQLARITNTKSRIGRILDGFAGNLWFVSIYLFLYFRLVNNGYSPYLILLLVIAGLSHSYQSAYADYYRNFYLFFVQGKNKGEIDDLSKLKKEYRDISWTKNFTHKFLMRVYINYTYQQIMFSKEIIRLYHLAKSNFPEIIPLQLSALYRQLNKPLIKYFNILTTNTRMIFLFIVLIIQQPLWYFLFEVSLLNILLLYVIIRHEKNSTIIYNKAVDLLSGRKEKAANE